MIPRLLLPLLFLLLAGRVFSDTPTSPTLRIISCAPNLAGMVYFLGLQEHLVGVSTFTTWPEEARDLPQVADLFNPNLEAMLRLRPTHILGLESTSRVNEFFRERPGVEVMTFGRIETLEEIDGAFLALAEAFNVRHRAESAIARRPSPRPRPEGVEPLRVLFVLGYGSGLSQLYAIGQGTYVSELLERAGAVNVLPAELGIYPSLSKEAVLRLRPDIILSTAPEGEVEQRHRAALRDWRPLATVPAVRSGDFRYISDPNFLLPGPWTAEKLPMVERLLWDTSPGGSVSPGDGG